MSGWPSIPSRLQAEALGSARTKRPTAATAGRRSPGLVYAAGLMGPASFHQRASRTSHEGRSKCRRRCPQQRGAETTGGSSANEIPDADEGRVPDNDDGPTAVATSTLGAAVLQPTTNQPRHRRWLAGRGPRGRELLRNGRNGVIRIRLVFWKIGAQAPTLLPPATWLTDRKLPQRRRPAALRSKDRHRGSVHAISAPNPH
jgi:hypothetical protein